MQATIAIVFVALVAAVCSGCFAVTVCVPQSKSKHANSPTAQQMTRQQASHERQTVATFNDKQRTFLHSANKLAPLTSHAHFANTTLAPAGNTNGAYFDESCQPAKSLQLETLNADSASTCTASPNASHASNATASVTFCDQANAANSDTSFSAVKASLEHSFKQHDNSAQNSNSNSANSESDTPSTASARIWRRFFPSHKSAAKRTASDACKYSSWQARRLAKTSRGRHKLVSAPIENPKLGKASTATSNAANHSTSRSQLIHATDSATSDAATSDSRASSDSPPNSTSAFNGRLNSHPPSSHYGNAYLHQPLYATQYLAGPSLPEPPAQLLADSASSQVLYSNCTGAGQLQAPLYHFASFLPQLAAPVGQLLAQHASSDQLQMQQQVYATQSQAAPSEYQDPRAQIYAPSSAYYGSSQQYFV